MASSSMLVEWGGAAALVIVVLSGVLYVILRLLKTSQMAETRGLFTSRNRRLSFVERTQLDGGRKLLLIRRDDMEHLILIGGPIDLVVETGITPPPVAVSSLDHELSTPREKSSNFSSFLTNMNRFRPQSQARSKMPTLSHEFQHTIKDEPLDLTSNTETKAPV